MALLITASRAEKEKRLNSILGKYFTSTKRSSAANSSWPLAFAKELETHLSAIEGPRLSTVIVDKLESHIRNFPDKLGSTATARYGDLDKNGTALWNLCTRLKRNNHPQTQQISVVLVMTRLFAFMMLDAAQSSGNGSFANCVRVMKVALKTARNCLGRMLCMFINVVHASFSLTDKT